METNFELIKKILITINDFEKSGNYESIQIKKYSQHEIFCHMNKLHEANLIQIIEDDDSTKKCKNKILLSYYGKNFLKMSLNNRSWHSSIDYVHNYFPSMPLDVFRNVLLMKHQNLL